LNGDTVVTDTSTFTVRSLPSQADENNDGLLDNPFDVLTDNGDSYISNVQVVRMDNDGNEIVEDVFVGTILFGDDSKQQIVGDPSISLESGDNRLTVTASNDLIQPGEAGVLVVEMAPSLEALLFRSEAAGAGDALTETIDGLRPIGAFNVGGHFVEVSVIVLKLSTGEFDEIAPEQVAANPIEFVYTGLEEPLEAERVPRLYKHDTFVGNDKETEALQIIAESGEWTEVANTNIFNNIIFTSLTDLSVFAPIDVIDVDLGRPVDPVASLDVEAINFGQVTLGLTTQRTVTVTNLGGGTLEGTATAGAPFSVIDGAYSLSTLASRMITVTFTPTTGSAFESELVFTGGSETVSIFVTGEGILEDEIPAPSGVAAEAGPGGVLVTWGSVDTPDFAGYEVLRGTTADNLTVVSGEGFLLPTASFFDRSVPSVGTFFYAVRTVTTGDERSELSRTAIVDTDVIVIFLPDVSGPAGSTVRVPVNIVNNSGVDPIAIEIDMRYPLELVDQTINTGGFTNGVKVQRTAVTRDLPTPIVNLLTPGRAIIGSILSDDIRLQGDGHLFDIVLRLRDNLGEALEGPLFLNKVDFTDRIGGRIPVTFTGFESVLRISTDCVLGDVDGDGDFGLRDAVRALLIAVGSRIPNDCERQSADINGDLRVDSADAVLILRLAIGLSLNPSDTKGIEDIPAEINLSIDTRTISEGGANIGIPIRVDDGRILAGADLTVVWDPEGGDVRLTDVILGQLTDRKDFSFKFNDDEHRVNIERRSRNQVHF